MFTHSMFALPYKGRSRHIRIFTHRGVSRHAHTLMFTRTKDILALSHIYTEVLVGTHMCIDTLTQV